MIHTFTTATTRLLIGWVVIGSLGLTACTNPSTLSDAASSTARAPENVTVVSYRSPTCGCCGAWVEHMRSRGFDVEDNVTEDMDAIKAQYGVPEDLLSCHTAIAAGYVIEGHTPAEDVIRLLAERPDITGIATPGMPLGSPGMEAGDMREPYAVYGFSDDAEPTVFAEHQQDS
jgi:hypothetical protein